jgi:hypothetical protein
MNDDRYGRNAGTLNETSVSVHYGSEEKKRAFKPIWLRTIHNAEPIWE